MQDRPTHSSDIIDTAHRKQAREREKKREEQIFWLDTIQIEKHTGISNTLALYCHYVESHISTVSFFSSASLPLWSTVKILKSKHIHTWEEWKLCACDRVEIQVETRGSRRRQNNKKSKREDVTQIVTWTRKYYSCKATLTRLVIS